MKKNIFFKFLFLSTFVLSLSIGFVGCKNYDDDLDKINERIDNLEKLIPTGTALVTDVTGSGNTITVTYSEGNPKTFTVGNGGTVSGPVTMGDDGYWYADNVKTNFKIVTENPRVNTETGYLEFATVGADGAIKWEPSTIYASGAYIVDAGANYELWVAKKGSTTLEKFLLPKGSGGLAKIDILGWYANKGNAGENISVAAIKNASTDNYVVNYAYVTGFPVDVNTAGTLGQNYLTGTARESWSGMTDVVKTQVLNTIGFKAERKGFIVNVHPANVDISSMEFVMENSKGGELPIRLGTPEQITGFLTRAASSSSALYFIPASYTTTTYPAVADYTKLFEPTVTAGVLYTLVEKTTGTRSEYTPWTATSTAVTSEESEVNGIVTGVAPVVVAETIPVEGLVYKVEQGKPYSLSFKEDGFSGTVSDYVIDYYVEGRDNNDFIGGKFGLSVDKKAGTFTVTRMPDDLTLATFELNVYKLGVDGRVYLEVIKIYPVRSNLSGIIPVGNYKITDEDAVQNYETSNVSLGTPLSATAYLSAKMTANLDNMFTVLEEQLVNGQTMKQRWQNQQYGAKTANLKSVTVGGVALNSTELATFKTNLNAVKFFAGNTDVTTELWKATSIVMQPDYAYEVSTPTDLLLPTFDLNKEYLLEFEFLDAQSNYLSTANVTFTPVQPALADMFLKEPAYWTGNQLNAYYKSPESWVANWFYTATSSTFYNVYNNTSTLNKHAASNPYDGGFLRFGMSTNGQQWVYPAAELGLKDASTQRIGNVLVNTLVNVGVGIQTTLTGDPQTIGNIPELQYTTVELLNQTPTGPANDANNGYGKVLKMAINSGNYLEVYPYSAADQALLDFDMKIMSALYEGRVEGTAAAGAITIEAASVGEIIKITDADIKGYNYNNSKAYSLFQKLTGSAPSGTASYEYTYINKVEFFVPANVTVYNIVDGAGAATTTAVAPTWVGNSGTNQNASYVGIKTNNITNTTTTSIGVRVFDRYGKVKETTIPLTIEMN